MISESMRKMQDFELDHINEEEDEMSDPDEDDVKSATIQTETVATARIRTKCYVLSLAATRETYPTLAAGLSNNTCVIYNLANSHIGETCRLTTKNQNPVVDCKFSPGDSNFFYTCTVNGIELWDLRSPQNPSVSFRDTTEYPKPLTCFDISSNTRLISAGSNVLGGDAFILFWDVRKGSLLGGYWESHTDDITQVKFHPDDMNRLISGSVDGLINIYDLSMPCEDDALIDSLNTVSSIDKLSWYKKGIKEGISCITHTMDLQLWYTDSSEPYQSYTRKEISKIIKKKRDEFLYIANCHHEQKSHILLVGSNHKNGACLRAAALKDNGIPTVWDLQNNDQRVRCSFYNENTNILISGGENGIVNVWKLQEPK